jgi:hypothetical protein
MKRWLAILCLGVGLRALGTAYVTLRDLDLYEQAGTAGPPALRMGLQAAFGILLLKIAWGFYRTRRWAYWALPLALGAYALMSVLWLVAYAQTPYDEGRWAFLAVTLAIGMGFVTGLWWRLRKRFGVNYGRFTHNHKQSRED